MIKKKSLTILGIETSCDETAVALVRGSGGTKNPKFKILSNLITSQIDIHAEWGGVVPNLAKREHIKNLPILYKRALALAKVKKIDALAVTVGPGLEPALWTGITFVQDLAQKLKLPVVAANHMEGHLVASLLKSKIKDQRSKLRMRFPALALLVSGGHTELVRAKGWGKYELIGETLDDAAGEAFDKVARMLGLGYPGGSQLSKLARDGKRDAFSFPRPMITSKNFNFSFSGLKTAVLYTLRDLKEKKIKINPSDIAASFEEAVVETLVTKTVGAMAAYRAKSLIVGGGVAANNRLREELAKISKKHGFPLYIPEKKFTTDNAAMIGAAGYFHAIKNDFTSWKRLEAHARLKL